MKYGIIYRRTTKNIGDDVQSYAQLQWLPSLDYLVDIEELDAFKSDNDEPVATIMSSWYMWQKWNWPPSKDIYPLWVGFHYNDIQRGRPRGMPSKWEYVDNGPGHEYLKKYEPIGCRDYYTQARMDELGIKNYFSGCITLTLKKRKIVKPEREYIVINGVAKPVEKAIKKQLEGSGIDIKVLAPTRPEPSTDMPWAERQAQVEEMLDLYQNAKCVITFRLHCALPSLALGTPVLLVRKSFKSVRFKPYSDWLHHAFDTEVIEGKYKDWFLNPPANPDDYLETRHALEKTVSEFLEKAKNETRKASELDRLKIDPDELMKWQHARMKETLHSYHIESQIDLGEMNRLKRKVANCENKISEYENKLAEMNKVKEENKMYRSVVSYSFASFLYRLRKSLGRIKRKIFK